MKDAARSGCAGRMAAIECSLRARQVELSPSAVLSSPPLDVAYKEANPVKYLANQVLHLTDVTALLERVTLADQD